MIEPANPQVVYVPQYNTQTVYTQPTTTVVVEETTARDVAVAGLIGFTAGIAIGAAVNNDYYYGPYGWHGGAYMYNDAWDDYYDAREDAREDWQDHREDLVEERGDRASNTQEQRTERRETGQEQRTERQQTRSETAPSRRHSASSGGPKRRHQRPGKNIRHAGRHSDSGKDTRLGETTATQARTPAVMKLADTARAAARRRLGTERRPLGRLLGLLERKIGTRGQFARTEQPEQLARRRGRPAPLTSRRDRDHDSHRGGA